MTVWQLHCSTFRKVTGAPRWVRSTQYFTRFRFTGCQPASAGSLHTDHAITVFVFVDSFILYHTFAPSICTPSASQSAPRLQHSRASYTAATSSFSDSTGSVRRVLSLTCDLFLRYLCRFSRTMHFLLHASFIFSLPRSAAHSFSPVLSALRGARCIPGIYSLCSIFRNCFTLNAFLRTDLVRVLSLSLFSFFRAAHRHHHRPKPSLSSLVSHDCH